MKRNLLLPYPEDIEEFLNRLWDFNVKGYDFNSILYIIRFTYPEITINDEVLLPENKKEVKFFILAEASIDKGKIKKGFHLPNLDLFIYKNEENIWITIQPKFCVKIK